MASFDLFRRKIPLPGWVRAGLAVSALGAAVLYWILTDPTERIQKEMEAGATSVRVHKPSPVAVNRNADVPDGFRGDVHPVLHGRTRLEVTAHWTALDRGQLKLNPAPDAVYSWYTGLRPAV